MYSAHPTEVGSADPVFFTRFRSGVKTRTWISVFDDPGAQRGVLSSMLGGADPHEVLRASLDPVVFGLSVWRTPDRHQVLELDARLTSLEGADVASTDLNRQLRRYLKDKSIQQVDGVLIGFSRRVGETSGDNSHRGTPQILKALKSVISQRAPLVGLIADPSESMSEFQRELEDVSEPMLGYRWQDDSGSGRVISSKPLLNRLRELSLRRLEAAAPETIDVLYRGYRESAEVLARAVRVLQRVGTETQYPVDSVLFDAAGRSSALRAQLLPPGSGQ